MSLDYTIFNVHCFLDLAHVILLSLTFGCRIFFQIVFNVIDYLSKNEQQEEFGV